MDGEEALGKVQHPFIIKTLRKVGRQGHIIKSIYETNIVLNVFSLRGQKQVKDVHSYTSIQYCTGSPNKLNKSRKRNKRCLDFNKK